LNIFNIYIYIYIYFYIKKIFFVYIQFLPFNMIKDLSHSHNNTSSMALQKGNEDFSFEKLNCFILLMI